MGKGFSFFGPIWGKSLRANVRKRKANQDAKQLTETATLKLTRPTKLRNFAKRLGNLLNLKKKTTKRKKEG